MKFYRVLFPALLVAVLGSYGADACRAEKPAALFSNYYVEPSIAGGIGSKLYPSPHPVPAWVGHTYYTYEGLYPHHHMWSHYHVYRRGKGPLGVIPTNTTRILYW